MTTPGGVPPTDADRSLGEIVADVSQKASLLVREEIELAKAEVREKVSKLGKGAAVGAIGAAALLFSLIYGLFGLAFLINDIFDHENVWLGFFVVTVLLIVIGAAAVAVAIRFFKGGSPPTPDLAIEEARRTRAELEEARR